MELNTSGVAGRRPMRRLEMHHLHEVALLD
jgi:hypothetical protein